MGTIGGILDVAGRSLRAQSQVIRVIGDNIANVNTPGYSRRNAELVATQATGTGNLLNGTGVDVQRVVRNVDEFLNREYLTRISDRAAADVRQQYLSRAEEPFSLEQTPGHIGYQLSQFFSSLQDLQSSPADLPLRTQVLQSGQALVSSIKDTYNQIASLQREADTRLANAVTNVNTLSQQIADINGQIVSGETANQQNLTLRDNRDELLRKLSELVPVNTLELANGEVQVTIANGFALVDGSKTNQLQFATVPDFSSAQLALDGGSLGFIVHDYDPTTPNSQSDFTGLLSASSGEIGGLLRLRGARNSASTLTDPFSVSGDLPQIAARVEAISRDLLTRFNMTYRGYNPSQFTQTPAPTAPFAGDENPATNAFDPSSGGLVDIPTPTNTNPGVYGLFTITNTIADTNADGLANDLTANGYSNYSSQLSFGVTDERNLATALDLDANPNSRQFSPGDAQNIAHLLTLRTQQVTHSVGGTNGFTATATIEDVYNQAVSYSGSASATAKSDFQAKDAREAQVKELHSAASGVSIDEELAKLINYQRAFQASAKMIKTGDELFDEIIQLIR
ncbi:MAG: flagellar hook-associated protein FlgK [Bdellovibrionota bacterium]